MVLTLVALVSLTEAATSHWVASQFECPPPVLHEHTFFVDGQRQALDFASVERGPKTFAQNLKRTLAQTFPIWIRAEVKAECTGDVIAQEIDVTGPV